MAVIFLSVNPANEPEWRCWVDLGNRPGGAEWRWVFVETLRRLLRQRRGALLQLFDLELGPDLVRRGEQRAVFLEVFCLPGNAGQGSRAGDGVCQRLRVQRSDRLLRGARADDGAGRRRLLGWRLAWAHVGGRGWARALLVGGGFGQRHE